MSSTQAPTPPPRRDLLTRLGAYGFGDQEPLILAALVTHDPLLLIGSSGTGKTFLLNTISEALGLAHRHYNASLIAFDDLVGFPFPDDAKETVRFLQTPATVWGAESVLIDELSRCKPEHQNRLFSLIHERRLQGLALPNLRYRWAAMNPPAGHGGAAGDSYLGSEPLDPALADRFGLIVEVGDWQQLSHADRRRITDPSGEGLIASENGALAAALASWQATFEATITATPAYLIEYVTLAISALAKAQVRVSPRRARLMARSLMAARIIVADDPSVDEGRLFGAVLHASLPHRAWGDSPTEEIILGAHQQAWTGCGVGARALWLQRFNLESTLAGKAKLLIAAPDHDSGSLAVSDLVGDEPPALAAAFAFAAFPAAAMGRLPLTAEGVHTLASVAQTILNIDAEVSWWEPVGKPDGQHPDFADHTLLLGKLSPARRARAQQLLFHCVAKRLVIPDIARFEAEFNRCVRVFAKVAA